MKDQIRIPSESRKGVYYIATWLPGPQRWTCTCPAHMYSRDGTCKHVRQLPPPTETTEQFKRVGRRAMSAKVKAMTKQVEHLRSQVQRPVTDPNPRPPLPKSDRRKSNPQKGYKRVRGPDNKFYITPNTPRPDDGYKFVPGKKGRIGTRVKIQA